MRMAGFLAALAVAGSVDAQTVAQASACQTVSVKSGSTTRTIVELYTSEGCDSCPPADKWFSTLEARTGAAVPLAFHVDYWDYIGWKDRFAKASYSERQRDTVRRQGGRTTYTPQVMVDGRDVRSWSFASQFESSVRQAAARVPRADLTLDAGLRGGVVEATLGTRFASTLDRTNARLYFAITENNLVSRVSAGENRGVTLKHDHVVRELVGPILPDDAGVRRSINVGRDWQPRQLSLVAFAQDAKTGEVLQAVAVGLCERAN
jgi:hypothetical protein